MMRWLSSLLLSLAFWSGLSAGQTIPALAWDTNRTTLPASSAAPPTESAVPDLPTATALPRMAPELALQVYQGRSALQSEDLAGYSAITVVRAQLPDTDQKGEIEVQRHFSAPHTLQFTPVRYTGDGFVKSNIIARVLQSEVDHVQKDDRALTAINNKNYKFSYKGTAHVDDRLVHVFHIKPRVKRPGLFKGRIFIDVYTGSLVRAEGQVVKSPSFFIKKLEFAQDYTDIGNFTFPSHMHSEAKARVVGRTIVDISHRDYQATALQQQQQSAHQDPMSSAIPTE
ncbi:MAG TPA: hypothetical protein VMT53_06255 [Terriglobales bacterium]|nr:hypothetical protein [Terriglobales bacterium]